MIRFGFIGCGKVSRFHADVILELHNKIVAVSARSGSRNIDKFSRDYHVSQTYDDWRKMINEQKPDALIVAVSWDQTENIIQDIINTGIPCLVEKPVALNSNNLRLIMKNTIPFHDRVMVGYNRRFYDYIPFVQEALVVKELVSVELNLPEAIENLIKSKSLKIAKHILIYMSSHWLDLLTFLVGKVKVVWIKKNINKQSGYVGAYNGILETLGNCVPVHLQANFNAPSNTSITFNFKDSIYRLCPIEILTIYKGMEILEPSAKEEIKRYVPKVENTFCVDATFKPGFFSQMKYFTEVFVQQTKPNKIACTMQDALNVTHLCEEISKQAV